LDRLPERRYSAPGSRIAYVLDLRSDVITLPCSGAKKFYEDAAAEHLPANIHAAAAPL
jgi:hypothetical protein